MLFSELKSGGKFIFWHKTDRDFTQLCLKLERSLVEYSGGPPFNAVEVTSGVPLWVMDDTEVIRVE